MDYGKENPVILDKSPESLTIGSCNNGNYENTEAEIREKPVMKQIALGLLTNFSTIAPSMSLGFSAVALPFLTNTRSENPLTSDQASWFASAAPLATPFGCLFAGPIADRYGRKSAMFCVNLVCFIGWLIITCAYYLKDYQYESLLIGRIFTGLSTGLSSVPASIYMAEIASPKLRGVLCTWASVSFSLGVLIVYFLGLVLQDNWGGIATISAILPCFTTVMLAFLVPESPSWLVNKGRYQEAQRSMCRIYGVKTCTSTVNNEVDLLISCRSTQISANQREKTLPEQISSKIRYLCKPNCLKPFILVLFYFLFQQFSGAFVIVFYAVNIVKEAGVTLDPYITIVLIALVRLLVSMLVSYICKLYGRRPLSIISGSGMTITMLCLAAYTLLVKQHKINQDLSYIPVILLLSYFFTSTLGFLPLPFALSAEVFPRKIRGTASGLASFFAYFFNFITVKVYNDMEDSLQTYGVFFFYGAVSLIGTLFIIFFLPETKGKSLEEIEAYFTQKPTKKKSLIGDCF